MAGLNHDLQSQMAELEKIILLNTELHSIIEKASGLGLQNYYIGAGCVAQTVWNYQTGKNLSNGISDVDFAYFDKADLSFEAENTAIMKIKSVLAPRRYELDIKNQARVHLWYKEHFGYEIMPYDSIENAINAWPTTATSVGVRIEENKLKVYAPYGLNDLFGMIVRANKSQITEEIYMQKVHKWINNWPSLTIIPW
jgi:hypothetical protein